MGEIPVVGGQEAPHPDFGNSGRGRSHGRAARSPELRPPAARSAMGSTRHPGPATCPPKGRTTHRRAARCRRRRSVRRRPADAKKGGARTLTRSSCGTTRWSMACGRTAPSRSRRVRWPRPRRRSRSFSPGSSMAWLLRTLLRRNLALDIARIALSWPGRCVAMRLWRQRAPLDAGEAEHWLTQSFPTHRLLVSCSTLLTGSKPAGLTPRRRRPSRKRSSATCDPRAHARRCRRDSALCIIARVLDRCHDEATFGVSEPRTAAAWEHVAEDVRPRVRRCR